MSVKTWLSRPLCAAVVELLSRRGALSDVELLDLLKNEFEGVGFRDLNRVLLCLEVKGMVYVSSMVRGKRRVELVCGRRGG